MAERACASCGYVEEPLAFCTECGAAHTTSVPVELGHSVAVAAANPGPASAPQVQIAPEVVASEPKVPSRLERVSDGVSRVACVVVGLGWAGLGVLIAAGGIATGSPGGFISLLCWAYAAWLFKPGGWKLLIY